MSTTEPNDSPRVTVTLTRSQWQHLADAAGAASIAEADNDDPEWLAWAERVDEAAEALGAALTAHELAPTADADGPRYERTLYVEWIAADLGDAIDREADTCAAILGCPAVVYVDAGEWIKEGDDA
jgi:hypothetical protein